MTVGYGDNPLVGPGGPEPKESSAPPKPKPDLPPAGPHDHPALTNPDSTPGTGALPPPGTQDDDMDSTSS